MPEIERIKEELGWLKVVFAALVAVDVSLVAWVAQNYAIAVAQLVWLASFGVLAISLVIVWVNRVVYRRLRKLESL